MKFVAKKSSVGICCVPNRNDAFKNPRNLPKKRHYLTFLSIMKKRYAHHYIGEENDLDILSSPVRPRAAGEGGGVQNEAKKVIKLNIFYTSFGR